jgi:putative ABC transport system permease protein
MNTAMFSIVNAVLLRPISYPDADRLVWIARYDAHYESFRDPYISRADYVVWRQEARSFERMTAYGNQDLAVGWRDEATQERIASITGDFWSMTGARPALGRLFAPGELNVIVLTHALFERRFAEDARVLGKSLTLNGHAFTVVGVLPSEFRFWFPQQFASGDEVRDIDGFISIPDAAETPGQTITQARGPAPHWTRVVGKLKPGATLEQARAEITTIHARLAREYPGPLRRQNLRLAMLNEKLVFATRVWHCSCCSAQLGSFC